MANDAAGYSTVVGGTRNAQFGGCQVDIFVSQIIVLVIGGLVIVGAGWGMLAPGKLMAFVTSAMDQNWGIGVD